MEMYHSVNCPLGQPGAVAGIVQCNCFNMTTHPSPSAQDAGLIERAEAKAEELAAKFAANETVLILRYLEVALAEARKALEWHSLDDIPEDERVDAIATPASGP